MLQPELTVLVLRSDEALLVTISSIRTDPTDPESQWYQD